MVWAFVVHVSLHWSILGMIISNFGVLMSNLLVDLTIQLQLTLISKPIIATFIVFMCVVAQCMSLIQISTIDKRFLSELSIIFGLMFGIQCANLCHLSIDYVSTLDHLLFDDQFHTVFSTGNDVILDDFCNWLFDSDWDFHQWNNEFTFDYPLHHMPPLDKVWLSEP